MSGTPPLNRLATTCCASTTCLLRSAQTTLASAGTVCLVQTVRLKCLSLLSRFWLQIVMCCSTLRSSAKECLGEQLTMVKDVTLRNVWWSSP
jgi:hypothetical protein